jgi:prolyl oligopeptidase
MAGTVASGADAGNMGRLARVETTMRKAILALVSACFLNAGAAWADATEDFAALLEEVWEWGLAQNPMQTSRQGDRRYNTEWRDGSLAGYEKRHLDRREFLRRVYAIGKSQLADSDQLNYELFRRGLQQTVDGHQFQVHLLPFNQRGGVQNLDSQAAYLRFETVADYDDWLARMGKIDAVVEQTIERAERGRDEGMVLPRVLMERIPDQIAVQLVESGTESPFYSVFETMPETVPTAEQERLRKAAVDTIEEVVVPAYRELADYFEDTYLPASRESVGLSSLPNGSAWYEFLARRYTTTHMTPDEIHRLGLDEVKRIRGEMQLIIDELEFEGDFQEFLTFLRSDPQFYYDNPDDLYEAYLATSKRIDPELVKLFGTLPRMPYGVKPIPDAVAPDTTTAYYSRPAADGSRAGIYWVNLYKPEVRPKYEIEVLSVHEAMPGHHLQLAIQQEIGDMPNFRRYSGFTAFVEGWGLYSESLGYDLGLYKDPYSRFGALTYDMWRAVRLVVDTGIHYKGWTRQQAIDFFKDNAAKTEHDIVNEIDRYIVMPGQALAYKVGQLKIKALRTQAESALGDNFDVRAFHDELLGAGALPLDILQQRMDAWLTEQLKE